MLLINVTALKLVDPTSIVLVYTIRTTSTSIGHQQKKNEVDLTIAD